MTPLIQFYPDEAARLADAKSAAPDFAIGASSVAPVLGRSRWAGPWDVWARAHGLEVEPEGEEREALQRGREWEPWVVERYAKRFPGRAVTYQQWRWTHPDFPWFRVCPDAAVDQEAPLLGIDHGDAEPASGLVEAKTSTNPDEWGEDGAEIRDSSDPKMLRVLPREYQLQGLSQLEVSGRAWVDFAAGILPEGWPRRFPELRVIRLWRQPALQKRLVKLVDAWRTKHLVNGVAPAVDGSRAANAALSRTEKSGESYRQAFAEIEEAVARIRELDRLVDEAEEERSKLVNSVVQSAEGSKGFLLPRSWGKEGKPAPKAAVVRNPGKRSVRGLDNPNPLFDAVRVKLLARGLWKPAPFGEIVEADADLAKDLDKLGLVSRGAPYARLGFYNLREEI